VLARTRESLPIILPAITRTPSHELVPGCWPYSTFQKYVQLGEYAPDWGNTEPENLARWVAPGGFIE
jgi:hypothetical protein